MATKLFPTSTVTASPSLFFKCPKKPRLEDDLKSVPEMLKMSGFLFSFSTTWPPTLIYSRGLCCFLDYLADPSSRLQAFASPTQLAFLPSLAVQVFIGFFPSLSAWWAVVSLLLTLLWLSSPGREPSWISLIAGWCWLICQESITSCTVHRLLKGCHHLIMY